MGHSISAPKDYHQPSQAFGHALEQPVKGQRKKDGHGSGEQVAQNEKAEMRLAGCDVVGDCARIPQTQTACSEWMRRRGAVRSVR
jgi:hypothetical protein